MPDLHIRQAVAADDARAIYDMLLGMLDESPMCKLDAWRALGEVTRVCTDEAAWIVCAGGTMVASTGLVEARVWYSDDPILVTRWLYARPEYRSAGDAWRLMADEAQALADATGMVTLLDVFNPARAGRRAAPISRAFRIEPVGMRLRVKPQKEAA